MIARQSVKRNAILNALKDTDTHPTAEWLYGKVKPLHPDLSLGTVYRSLAALRGEGELISVGVVDGKERFDGRTDPHTHFVCETCGEVSDIESEPLRLLTASLDSRAAEDFHGKIDSHNLIFYGTCEKCLKIKNMEDI